MPTFFDFYLHQGGWFIISIIGAAFGFHVAGKQYGFIYILLLTMTFIAICVAVNVEIIHETITGKL